MLHAPIPGEACDQQARGAVNIRDTEHNMCQYLLRLRVIHHACHVGPHFVAAWMAPTPCPYIPHGLIYGGRNMLRSCARIEQQTEGTETHGQLGIAALKLDEQPTVALIKQNCDRLSTAEKVPVCISDGL